MRLRGVAFRGLGPGTARTRVSVAWRTNDENPLVTQMLETIGRPVHARSPAPPDASPSR
jgi:hypothetical protein